MSIRLDHIEDQQNSGLAEFNLLFEDDKTKITSWRFAPGTETGWHHHNFDYVTIQNPAGGLSLKAKAAK